MVDRKGGGSRPKRTGGSAGGGIFRRGPGLNTGGPVGKSDGYSDRNTGGFSRNTGGSSGSTGGRGILSSKSMILVVLLVVGYFILKSCGVFDTTPAETIIPGTGTTAAYTTARPANITGIPANNDINPSTGITGPRTARTVIQGGGADVYTIMVYMCGTDLESRSGMATADLNEMLYATIGDNVNLIVETGGASKWQNTVVKDSTIQRYQVTSSGLKLLQDNIGDRSMTDPATLQDFVSYCATNYPANRNALILWDHGGGSLGGYGYDERFPNSGAMSINEIHSALEGAGVKFDFVGFDACLMATLETAYMLNYHADYMIASEETEPGIGWYYTDWITALSADPSMPTAEIGRQIIDGFTAKCAQEAPRDITTLSLLDLVVLNNVVDDAFRGFAVSSEQQLDTDYKVISNARGDSREFNKSELDQVDLVDLAGNIDSAESRALVDALRQCVLYNKTSGNISKANGVSIYFPYDELRNLSSMLSVYEKIGMGEEYTTLVKKFANLVVGGQITTSGSDNAVNSLLGTSTGGSSGSASDLWSLAWNTFFAGSDFSSFTGALSGDKVNWIDEGQIKGNADFFQQNYLDANDIKLTKKGDTQVLRLTDAQWDLIRKVELNVFFDDGEGYIDLGLDNVYEFDSDGDLVVGFDGTWIAIGGHVGAYYADSSEESGDQWTMTGHMPALLNGQRVDIALRFDNADPYGVVAGARIQYESAVTDTIAKGLIEIVSGDTIDFLCDYYTYDEKYENSYYLGDPMTVSGDLIVENVPVGSAKAMVTYRLTDIYNNTYWTPAVEWAGN